MPPQDGGRLHNSSQSQQAWPEPRHPHHQGPVTPPQPQTLRREPLDNVELMTPKEDLQFKTVIRLEEMREKKFQQGDDPENRIGRGVDFPYTPEIHRVGFFGTPK